ncbi:MAG: DUF4430 domain-containing protein [Oscillospiraceae bacterium]|nr:DUF4430 domain-containing protein [Oscillospiraceae bacterium]
MKSKISAVISCIIAVFLLTFAVYAEQLLSAEIIEYNLSESGAENIQEWIDTVLTENAGASSEWYVIALSKNGEYDFAAYKSALETYLNNNDIRSATSRQKYALALLTVGSNSDYIAETMENSIGEQGLMSYVYGLHLLNNGCTSTSFTSENVIEQIISMQLADGGWAVMGEYGDPDVTAMTIQALAPHYKQYEQATTAIDKAVQFLSDKQLENGGYKSMGKEVSESISQVIIALSELDIDVETDSRFIKNGNTLFSALEQFRLNDGSYCHEIGGTTNHTSTVQAFMASVAYENEESLFITDKSDDSDTETTATVTALTTEATSISEAQTTYTAEKNKSYKPLACVVIGALTVLACLILLLTKKCSRKNFIAITIFAAAAITIVLFTDFSTAEDYYGTASEKSNPIGTVTIEIRCDTVAGKEDYIPESGVILEETEYAFETGETVYDILVEACRENNIQTEFSGSYISGMNYIYEFDFGELSGWMYFVNGEEASVGCNSYTLADGDRIKWVYSLEMGKDLK